MADDMRRAGKPHDQLSDDQDHELTYWSEKLGVSRDRLREAVAKVGSMRKAVEQQQRQPGYAKAD
jgi:DNA-binding FadR family transcriptional regulator